MTFCCASPPGVFLYPYPERVGEKANSAKGSTGWAGIYWLYPLNNWGEYTGYNIIHPKKLTFWAKGEKDGEISEFKVGGISNKDNPYQDSFGPLSTNPFHLTTHWKEYSIDLTGRNLNMII